MSSKTGKKLFHILWSKKQHIYFLKKVSTFLDGNEHVYKKDDKLCISLLKANVNTME